VTYGVIDPKTFLRKNAVPNLDIVGKSRIYARLQVVPLVRVLPPRSYLQVFSSARIRPATRGIFPEKEIQCGADESNRAFCDT
jgi:hypothetical protein